MKLNLFLFLFSLCLPSENYLKQFEGNWNIIQDDRIQIFWQYKNNTPFCKASIVYNSPSKKVKEILEDKENYPNIFHRIESTDLITKDIVHIKLNLPFPFYGRDYIVKYDYLKNNDIEYFFYKATQEVKIDLNKKYVRLVNAEGLWRINSIDENNTELTYIWNGELLGDFPDWALKRAWLEQGNEVLTWIEQALH